MRHVFDPDHKNPWVNGHSIPIDDAWSSLATAVKAFEKGRLISTGHCYKVAPTGEEFLIIVNGVIVEERESALDAYPTSVSAEDAVRSWFDGIMKWADGKNGTIYWRMRPSLECSHDGKWKVFSRLLISDRAIVNDAVENAKKTMSDARERAEAILATPPATFYRDFSDRRYRFNTALKTAQEMAHECVDHIWDFATDECSCGATGITVAKHFADLRSPDMEPVAEDGIKAADGKSEAIWKAIQEASR